MIDNSMNLSQGKREKTRCFLLAVSAYQALTRVLAWRSCQRLAMVLSLILAAGGLHAATQFFEAEDFVSETNGWKPAPQRTASAVRALHGASGDAKDVARKTVTIDQGGVHRIWVRFLHVPSMRGPFDLTVRAGDRAITNQVFDLVAVPGMRRWDCVWDSIDVSLPAGEIVLELSKHEQKNCSGYTRLVDCLVVTDDLTLEPDHRDYGPQTFVRVTLGDIYEEPVYVHLFADHYRAPWYGHHYLARNGTGHGLGPAKANLLQAGEQTPWCNISRILYQDSGAILNMTIRHSYYARPERMKATFEFATAPHASAIVRTMDVEAQPNGLVVVMPPDLVSEENRARLGRDLDFAMKTGEIADNYNWPTIGRKPERFPFFVAAGIGGYGTPPDQAVIDRERKTLDYFGFSNWTLMTLGAGTWGTISNSYCRPDTNKIMTAAAKRGQELAASGNTPADIVYCMVMDEPGGQSLEFMAQDDAYQTAFRQWLRQDKRLTPADLLVADWSAVKTVTRAQAETSPALYYYSQRFRTQALGDFMATQRRALEEACGGPFPVNANFSDGATYHANFYSQGVDYFELLDDDGQNAIWGEDWANGSSSYQCGAYNVDLMRAAARDRGQVIGHYLIAHAGRKALDIKLKAAGNVARGTKMLKSFSYGVYWGSHEGGPAWRSHVWHNKPEVWGAHAELLREIGAVEDLLLPAMPARAEVALLYSSASDVWSIGHNLAYGFDRMHTWMALVHAQIPVDFVSEDQVAAGGLDGYRVCYFSGPNLARNAATKLATWVRAGGTLVATAGAGERDEYNRPLTTIAGLLPAERGELETLQNFQASGHYLSTLQPKGRVIDRASGAGIDVLSVFQPLTPREGGHVVATNTAGVAAWVRGSAGKGTVHALGFLPALDYIRQALVVRKELVQQNKAEEQATIDGPDASKEETVADGIALTSEDRQRIEISANPWAYPSDVREALLAPARAAGIQPPIVCSEPLVDAIYMTCDKGIVIPLANYTLLPLSQVEFAVRVPQTPKRVESVHQGAIAYRLQKKNDELRIVFTLPLDSTDYVTIRWL